MSEELMKRCVELGLPILGRAIPEVGGGVVVALALTNKQLRPLEAEGCRLIPSGEATIVQRKTEPDNKAENTGG